ncbi:hypothetical protein [Paenibacillus hexagrammi]|uniref:Uncharacterized protein n=1 Tax=Paenibacillus hexagrammi TaxID=2908839 RepID=A0ABY3SD03_9BACL|nr:hypothetical protein [Paenibacillus sp. YPD9-1]UJF31838.1 hypothetical protein L0M14_18980 [Paenibacillus sp. YPD9-1]
MKNKQMKLILSQVVATAVLLQTAIVPSAVVAAASPEAIVLSNSAIPTKPIQKISAEKARYAPVKKLSLPSHLTRAQIGAAS